MNVRVDYSAAHIVVSAADVMEFLDGNLNDDLSAVTDADIDRAIRDCVGEGLADREFPQFTIDPYNRRVLRESVREQVTARQEDGDE